MKSVKYILVFFLLAFFAMKVVGQHSVEKIKIYYFDKMEDVISIYDEVEIEESSEFVWDKIAIEFANLGDFHPEMDYSFSVDKSLRYGLHAWRHCQIDDVNFIRESIVEWDENKKVYTYRLEKSEGLCLKVKQCDFGVKIRNGKTYIFHKTNYRMKTKIKTRRMKKKMERENLNLLLMYKSEIENSKLHSFLSHSKLPR